MNTTPSEIIPEQQLVQIAAILARGILRLKKFARHDPSVPAKEVSEFAQSDLEDGEKLRLSVSQRHGF